MHPSQTMQRAATRSAITFQCLKPFHFDWRSFTVAVSDLFLVRPMLRALVLSSISAFVTPFIFSVRRTMGGFPSGAETIAGLAYWPNLILALSCLAYALANLRDRSRRELASLVLLLSCFMPVAAEYPVIQAHRRTLTRERLEQWQELGATINPLLREYYDQYPDRFHFYHGDDEAEVDGFSDYLRRGGISVAGKRLVDPWGDPVHFVVDHDRDFLLRARGKSYGVRPQAPGKLPVGLLLDRPTRIQDWGHNDEWALKNGYIPVGK